MSRWLSVGVAAFAVQFAFSLPALAQAAGTNTPAIAPAASSVTAPFSYDEVMVSMRDGVRLQTVILRPTSQTEPLPILLRRTPYGVPDKAPSQISPSLKAFAADGYIVVIQNIRGRFKSEGVFTLSDDYRVTPGEGTIETRDGYDTIDWLVKHVANNNGKVGIYGVSYDGYTAGATLLHPHPALKAVSEQASPANQWMNDDDHRYGALRLSYDFEYSVLEEQEKTANTNFAFDTWDTYDWYLRGGSLADLEAKYTKGRIPHLRDTIAHPDYDAFWKSQAWANALTSSTVPNLNVAGFWDQEDPWGPWHIFRQAARSDSGHTNLMVAGPWVHGAWRAPTWTSVGPLQLGHDTASEFRRDIEAPYFAYWLHGRGKRPSWTATTFQTGSNTWRQYAAWPPQASKPVDLYLHADGRLTFQAPTSAEAGGYRQFVSDPANPVPYRARPISPTYPGQDWRRWEMSDQRFVDHRPDVLTYESDPLTKDLVVTGEVSARIMASTSGTDGDLIVKLIDVAPDDAQKPDWDKEAGAAEGQYAKLANGYQLPIAMEVRRGRYLESFEHPHALPVGKPVEWNVPLRDRDHVFLKGHKIMVQVQATWFPVIDRNPQTFVPSITRAKPQDYKAATYRVYASPDLASRITLPVVGSGAGQMPE